jgi:hypothetical protein
MRPIDQQYRYLGGSATEMTQTPDAPQLSEIIGELIFQF